jgi:hypothetical protein
MHPLKFAKILDYLENNGIDSGDFEYYW